MIIHSLIYSFTAQSAFCGWCLVGLIVSLIIGINVGSFLNVVIYRTSAQMLDPDRDISVVHPKGSFCPSCSHALAWYHNIPILSWILLRGKCAFCKSSISPQYPLTELATGLAFAFWYTHSANLHSLLCGWVFYCLLLSYIGIYFSTGLVPTTFAFRGALVIFALDLTILYFNFTSAIYPLVLGAVFFGIGRIAASFIRPPDSDFAPIIQPHTGQLDLLTPTPLASEFITVSTPRFVAIGFLNPYLLLLMGVSIGSVIHGVANLHFIP